MNTSKKRVLIFPCGSEIGLEVNRALSNDIHFEMYGASSLPDHGKFVFKNYIEGIPFVDKENFIDEIEVNYLGCINIALASHKYLKETKGSLIFYTSSSYTRGRALYSIYSSSKAAVVNLTQAISEEWENDNIRVNVINPERTATPMKYANFGKEPEETLLSPQKVAEESLNVLLSDYTGQVIDIRKINY